MSVHLKGCLPHVCSYLQSLHGHIAAFEKGSYKSPISASAYGVHMREAKQWNAGFRPIYAMGDVPLSSKVASSLPCNIDMPLPMSTAGLATSHALCSHRMWHMPVTAQTCFVQQAAMWHIHAR